MTPARLIPAFLLACAPAQRLHSQRSASRPGSRRAQSARVGHLGDGGARGRVGHGQAGGGRGAPLAGDKVGAADEVGAGQGQRHGVISQIGC